MAASLRSDLLYNANGSVLCPGGATIYYDVDNDDEDNDENTNTSNFRRSFNDDKRKDSSSRLAPASSVMMVPTYHREESFRPTLVDYQYQVPSNQDVVSVDNIDDLTTVTPLQPPQPSAPSPPSPTAVRNTHREIAGTIHVPHVNVPTPGGGSGDNISELTQTVALFHHQSERYHSRRDDQHERVEEEDNEDSQQESTVDDGPTVVANSQERRQWSHIPRASISKSYSLDGRSRQTDTRDAARHRNSSIANQSQFSTSPLTIAFVGIDSPTAQHFVRNAADAGYAIRVFVPTDLAAASPPPASTQNASSNSMMKFYRGVSTDHHVLQRWVSKSQYVVCFLNNYTNMSENEVQDQWDDHRRSVSGKTSVGRGTPAGSTGCQNPVAQFIQHLYPVLLEQQEKCRHDGQGFPLRLVAFQANSLSCDGKTRSTPLLSKSLKLGTRLVKGRSAIQLLQDQDKAIRHIVEQHDKHKPQFSYLVTRPSNWMRDAVMDAKAAHRLSTTKKRKGAIPVVVPKQLAASKSVSTRLQVQYFSLHFFTCVTLTCDFAPATWSIPHFSF
jgi:hypothetical protein